MSGSLKVLRRGACLVLLTEDEVIERLQAKPKIDPKFVLNARAILVRLAEEGLESVNNTEQFVFEGRFPDGTKKGTEIAVYAVKAYQLRIYGGIRTLSGDSSFI